MKRWYGALVIAMAASVGCASVVPNIRPSEDAAAWARMDRIGKRIVAAATAAGVDTKDVAWRFAAIEVEGAPFGAGSLPDGAVGVDMRLARTLTDDELAFFIGHEVGHVILRHAPPRMARTLGGIVVTVSGATAGFIFLPLWGGILTLLGIETTRELVTASFDRDDEDAADAYGLWLLASAGYRSDAAVRAFQKADQYAWYGGFPNTTVFDDHPSTSDRIARVRELVEQNGYR